MFLFVECRVASIYRSSNIQFDLLKASDREKAQHAYNLGTKIAVLHITASPPAVACHESPKHKGGERTEVCLQKSHYIKLFLHRKR